MKDEFQEFVDLINNVNDDVPRGSIYRVALSERFKELVELLKGIMPVLNEMIEHEKESDKEILDEILNRE